MNELDFGPHERCCTCGKLQPHRRCIEYNDKWFCCIQCKLKEKEREDEALRTGSAVARLPRLVR